MQPILNSETPVRVLVVDDEDHICRMVTRLLEEKGYACEQALSAEEPLEALDEADFALVVADIMMPGMSGPDLLRKVKERQPDVAAIMLTGVDKQDTAIEALELGAYGYMIKPFQENELLINVANALRRRIIGKPARRPRQSC